MTEKDLIEIFNNDFQKSGDCYGEERLTQVIWDSLKKTDTSDRESGCRVVAKLTPSGTGFVWLCIKDGNLYTNWETKKATTLIPDDGSDYYKELYNRVNDFYPELLNKTYFIPGFRAKIPRVEISICGKTHTFFGVRDISPDWLSARLQEKLPEFHFDVEKNAYYPYGPCIRVNNTNCKLEIIYDSWRERTEVSFIVYK